MQKSVQSNDNTLDYQYDDNNNDIHDEISMQENKYTNNYYLNKLCKKL